MALTNPLPIPSNRPSASCYGIQPSPPIETVGYNREKLKYPYKWRDYDIDYPGDRQLRARFPARHATLYEANPPAPHEDFAYTEVEVRSRMHRRLGLSVSPRSYHESLYLAHDPIRDLEHKKQIAGVMLESYFNTGEGRGLNIDKSGGTYFNKGTIEKISEPRDLTERIAITNKNDYFEDFRYPARERPRSKSFVKGMEYDPMSGRIEVDIETVNYIYSDHPIGYPEANPACPDAFIDPSEFGDALVGTGTKAKEYIRAQLKSKLTIIVKSRARPIQNIPDNERVAIETLREMITEAEFRKYIKDGFILVRGLSGRIYQIFRDQHHTKVWEKGKLVEEVCVRLKSSKVPPTDNVIAFRTAILCSESEFRKLGNVYKNMAA